MSMAPLNYMHAIVATALSAAPEEPAVLRASHTAAERLVETGNFYLATGVSAVRPVDSHSGVSIPEVENPSSGIGVPFGVRRGGNSSQG